MHGRYIPGKAGSRYHIGGTAGLRIIPAQEGTGIITGINDIGIVIIIPGIHKTSCTLVIHRSGPGSPVIGTAAEYIVYIRTELILSFILVNGYIATIPTGYFNGTIKTRVIQAVYTVILGTCEKVIGLCRMYRNRIKLFQAKSFIPVTDRGAVIH